MKIYLLAFIVFPWTGCPIPILHEVIQGEVRIEQGRDLLTITAPDESIIDWRDFSIQEKETACFVQPSAQSVVLNRVIEANPSRIFGKLEANGKILLINPNGFVFGKDCVMDTASLIASTLDLKSFQFNCEYQFEAKSFSSIVNLGTIRANQGDLFLIGAELENQGFLEAKNGAICLAAASNIQLKEGEQQRVFSENKTDSDRFKTIVSGTLSSKNNGAGGEIFLFGKTIEIADGAMIDTSDFYGGGMVRIGGSLKGGNRTLPIASRTIVAPNALITADCTQEGNGGEVVIWGDEVTGHWGTTFARGGPLHGDGGFVEISSPQRLIAEGKVDTTAANGKVGTLLLDPTVVTISSAVDAGIATSPPPSYTFFGPTADVNNLSLQGFLMTNSVEVDATTGGGIGGAIIVLDPVMWGPLIGTRLTLRAPDFMVIQADILENSPAPFPGGSVVLINGSFGQIEINGGPFPIGIGKSVSVGSQHGLTIVGDPDLPRCLRSRPILLITAFGAAGMPSTSRLGFQIPPGGMATGPIDVSCFDFGVSSGQYSLCAIGHGDSAIDPPVANLINTTSTATITVDTTGSGGVNAFSDSSMSVIGHGSFLLDPNSVLEGDICLTMPYDIIARIDNALTSVGSKAAIGHGAAPGSDFANASGNISLFTTMSIILHSGEAANSFAIIGHFPIAVGGMVSGDIFLSALLNVKLSSDNNTSTTNVNTLIGHYNSDPTMPILDVTGNISVSAGANICMRAGIHENRCGIGHVATNLSGIVAVSAGGILTMINQNDDMITPVYIGSTSVALTPTAHTFVATVGDILLGENLSGSYCCPMTPFCLNMPNGNSGQIAIRAPGDLNVASQSDIVAIGSNNGSLNSFISTLNDIFPATTRICVRGSTLPQNGPPINGTPFLLGVDDNSVATDSSIDFRAGDSIQMLNNFVTQALGYAYLSATTTFLPGQLWTTNGNQLTSVCGQPVIPFSLTSCGSCPVPVQPVTFLTTSPLLPPPVLCGTLPTNSILIDTKSGDITLLNQGLPIPPATPVGFCSTCTPCQTLTLGPFPNDIQIVTVAGDISISTFHDIIVNQSVSTLGNIFIEACQDLFVNSSISIPGAGTGNIELVAGRDLDLSLGVTIATNTGSICLSAFQDALLAQRILSNTGTITAQAGRNITIPTTVLVRTSNAILMAAGENLIMTGTAQIQSTGSSVTLVVDNAFPAQPLIGPGSFQMGSFARIDALTAIRIFTAQQGLNNIQGQFTVNALLVPFSPSTNLFTDTATEVSCTYVRQPLTLCAPWANPFSGCGIFPAPLGNSANPLTVFYKPCLQQITVQAMEIIDEFLVDLHPYDEFPGWMVECWAEYRRSSLPRTMGRLSSFDILPNEPYYFRRRLLNVIDHPKSWTQFLPYSMDQ